MKKIVIGILAHVDAGKTTLSESMLYTAGIIRKLGRVDNRDAFLDTYEMERQRGITIFSKQAVITSKETIITLIDTPGHTDFCAETERTLNILDYGILVISAADGVQAHTVTLWRLLEHYGIPTFIFINKTDRPDTHPESILADIRKRFTDACISFDTEENGDFYDSVAMTGEEAMEELLEKGYISHDLITGYIKNRKIFPCYFGSALKCTGVDRLLEGLEQFSIGPDNKESGLGGRIYKIRRDDNGTRETFLKVTEGTLKVRELINNEKINQIRIYNGQKYTVAESVDAGTVCAVTGPVNTRAGMSFGSENEDILPITEAVMSYRLILPKAADPVAIFPKLKLLEEELPELNPEWDETGRCINLRIMGVVQTEVLQKLIRDRLGIVVEFGTGNIIYKETIHSRVEGVGHYEPLKHYAEVHLLMEPLKAGSGLIIASDCKEDILDRNWQRLIMSHLGEKTHRGVLTGSAITDMKITLMTGRAHVKHTEGGDFREATYRAVRQGLMNAESVLLEPVYEFELEVLSRYMGRALTDIKRMNGSFNPPCTVGDTVIITGSAPAATIGNYNQELAAYSAGTGRLRCVLKGYEPCHNQEEVITAIGYDAESDMDNPSSSVFCANGTGFNVPWNEISEYMHLESCLTDIEAGSPTQVKDPDAGIRYKRPRFSEEEYALGTKEVDAIIDSAGGANRSKRNSKWNYSGKGKGNTVNGKPLDRNPASHRKLPGYILVDGYNVIFAWKELSRLAEANIDSARDRLLDILCNYQALIKSELIVVFDAYRVKGHAVEYCDYHNIHVVYTAEAETADRYIERFAHENGRKYDVTVVTSDGQEQIIVIGQGCRLCSSREFESEVTQTAVAHMEQYAQHSENSKVYMSEILQKNIDNLSLECNNSDIAE